ncbi:OapC/ArvC family zinc-ribbon domain-containing protein [Natronobeatus ordinarius]|uniref:OapC/ArvC family zinc-ribbon domain-containing protein n=1 Tax=Natronobeatus ordinarius TaxID=2963433 RepID=UPI0020CBC2E6|nr:Zn-ribbon containing protein [Natronobeatus ordinarius]
MPHQCTTCGRTFADGSKEMLSGCPDCGGNKFQFVPSDGETGDTASGDGSTDDSRSRESDGVPDWVSSATTGAPDPDSSARSDDLSWPPAETATESAPFDGFSEWPDSARRPEDRSSSDADQSTAPQPRTDAAEVADDGTEDTAQADARSSVVAPDELPAAPERAHEPPERERGSATSERGSATSERGSATSERGSATSERGSATSERGSATSERGSATSERGSATNEHEHEPPEHGRVISEPSGDRPSLEELREELNEQFESIKIVRPGEYELNLMELYNREEHIVSLQEDGRYVIEVPDSWRDGE